MPASPPGSLFGRTVPPNPFPVVETFATGKGTRRRAMVTYADGTRGPVMVHTAPIRDSRGDVELVVEIVADIGEVRRLQERLQATQQRYQQLFDEAPCYITVQAPDLTIRAANRRFQEDFDLTVGAFCHKIYKGPRDRPAPTARCQNLCRRPNAPVRNGGDIQAGGDLPGAHSDRPHPQPGRRHHPCDGDVHQHHPHPPAGGPAGLAGLMIGSVSHGIKGLLTGLDGGMYLLDSGFKKENQQQIREGWDTVRFMVGRIRGMVLDILYYAKEKDLKVGNGWTSSVLPEEVLRTVAQAERPGHHPEPPFRFGHRPFRGGCRHRSQRPDQHHRKCRRSLPVGPVGPRPRNPFRRHPGRGRHLLQRVRQRHRHGRSTRANVFTPFSLPRAIAAPAWDCSSPTASSASTAEAFPWNRSRRPAAAFP
jgi:hypothetical protein